MNRKQKYHYTLLIFTICVAVSSCLLDKRGRVLKSEQKKLHKGKITKEQYDSILFSFYTINDSNYKTDSTLLKYEGVYVTKRFKHSSAKYQYSTLKIAPFGNVFLSRYMDTLTDKSMDSVYKYHYKYTVLNDEFLMEVLEYDNSFNLVNSFGYARISGDSLIFYKHHTLEEEYGHHKITPNQYYIYCDTLKN